MAIPEPADSAQAVVQRVKGRLPISQTGSERRMTDMLIHAFAPEFYAIQRQLDELPSRLIHALSQREAGGALEDTDERGHPRP